jgi:hypothetical protein
MMKLGQFSIVVASILTLAATAWAQWNTAGEMGDWTGHDYACSEGQTPKPEFCTVTSRNTVAVCWLNRKTGECNNVTTWCTYKNIPFTTKQDGKAPGLVFVCR